MRRDNTPLSYRRAAIEGASPIGLVVALYDTLSGDLGRAAAALRANDIEQRCKHLNHALLILGHLEDWLDTTNGGDLAQSLAQFYAYLRGKLLEASLAQSAPLLEAQIELILQVRSAWQQRDLPSATPTRQTAFSQSA